MSSGDRKTILIVSQTFVPDPASVGQHVADVAVELARRGHAVRVNASARGYEDPTAKYPRRENLAGVDVRRFPLASFGKKSLILRVLGTAVFHLQAFFAALFTPNLAGIFFSTSPPLIGLPLCIAAWIRRVPAVYWAMDLNPDQLIALGKLRPGQFATHVLESANRFILRRSSLIVALDRFMADRLAARGVPRGKMLVLPPWPHEQHMHENSPTPGNNPFRSRHHLDGKFVFMYSGNHSPSNPLTTLLDAIVRLKNRDDLRFLFVGGGSGKPQVEQYIREHQLANTLSLGYQPLAELKYSLTAADVHVVALGEAMVGIVHPCKIYGAMAIAKPILFLGPRPSHISDLLDRQPIGVQISHDDIPAAVAAIETFAQMSRDELGQWGGNAQKVLEQSLSQQILCKQFCDAVETAFHLTA